MKDLRAKDVTNANITLIGGQTVVTNIKRQFADIALNYRENPIQPNDTEGFSRQAYNLRYTCDRQR